ncbi:MAG: phosphoglycerate mutase family protein [Chloroflexi bacterium]|nr:phosphoglycerate mutase family protein [Chloroflexota bacterium]
MTAKSEKLGRRKNNSPRDSHPLRKDDCHVIKHKVVKQNMELYFIRHGQSVNNAGSNNPEYKEHPDPYLTEMGIEQAKYLAKYLKEKQHITNDRVWNNQNQFGFGFTHIYTSLMERAVANEDKFSGLPGKPRSFFEKNFPELKLPNNLDESGWWNRPFESDEERQPRADNFFAELIARHADRQGQPEERIAIVSHGGFFVRLISSMLKLPWRQAAFDMKSWFLLNNSSISRFDIRDGEIMISYINQTRHLPAHLISG